MIGDRLDRLAHRRVAGTGAGVDRLADRVDELHEARDDDVELERLEQAGRIREQVVGLAAQRRRPPCSTATSGGEVTSPEMRQARARNFAEPAGETSAQSMSSSGGPANAIVRRTASTPCSSSCSESRTRLPRLFDIAEPFISTMPWLSSALNGSVKVR